MNTMVKNAVLAPFNALYAVSPELCLKALRRQVHSSRLRGGVRLWAVS